MAQYMDRGRQRVEQDTPPAPGRSAADSNNSNDPIDAAGEDRYWRDNYRSRPYADDTLSYDHYRPAYRYGWESRCRFADQRWDQVERDLQRGWRQNRGESRLGWGDAKLAARDAWHRVGSLLADQRLDAV